MYRNENKFVVKLPFSTNSIRIKYAVGMDGIISALQSFIKNDSVFGYIPYAMIQPELPENAEVKIVCFNGEPKFKSKVKKGKNSRSPFGRAKQEVFFAFARTVIDTIRRLCPEIDTQQVLRIDVFGFRGRPGVFIVNELEGYEAQKSACGINAGVAEGAISVLLEEYWFNIICDLVDYHIQHELPRLGLGIS
jgi:hypothetical protein